MPKSEKEKEITDRNEFKEECANGLKEWDIEDKILEESVGDCRDAGNHEPGKEEQVTNYIAESPSGDPQRELSQGKGEFSRERSQKL